MMYLSGGVQIYHTQGPGFNSQQSKTKRKDILEDSALFRWFRGRLKEEGICSGMFSEIG
jgi:hypothetical protein